MPVTKLHWLSSLCYSYKILWGWVRGPGEANTSAFSKDGVRNEHHTSHIRLPFHRGSRLTFHMHSSPSTPVVKSSQSHLFAGNQKENMSDDVWKVRREPLWKGRLRLLKMCNNTMSRIGNYQQLRRKRLKPGREPNAQHLNKNEHCGTALKGWTIIRGEYNSLSGQLQLWETLLHELTQFLN